MSSLPNRLKEAREKNGLLQKDVAEKLNITTSSYGFYEQGKRRPTPELLSQIADLFNVSTDYLLGKPSKESLLPKTPTKKGIKIPVLGEVQAGIPIEAIEDIIDYEEIDEDMAALGDYFCLQVRGQSMEPKFSEGDVVVVRKQNDVDSGDIAIVLVNGDAATIKQVKKQKDGIRLIPLNPAFDTTFFSNEEIYELPVTIIGKVVELRCKF